MRAVKAAIVFVVLSSASASLASTLSPPTLLAPAQEQGTHNWPWFRWTTVGTHFYRICIWPIQMVAGYCPDGASVKAFVDGEGGDTQSWRPDAYLPSAWMGERLRVTVMTCNATLCGDDRSRDFFALNTPTALTVSVDAAYPYYTRFNWSTVRSADSYLVSFCCNATGEPRRFLAPGGSGGRPFQLAEPESFAGLQDYSTRTACFSPGKPISWTVAACRDGGCGNTSPKRTFCYGGGTPSNAPPG